MARKQSDYLASLLAENENPAPVPDAGSAAHSPASDQATTRAGLSLLGRENALARVASGEVRQVTQLLLDPVRVKIWDGNARIQAKLSEESCRDLIDSILAEGGQKVPAVVRHLKGDPDHDYELIAGTRRHFAISWLRANSYPEMKLLAQVADLDNEAAFRLADIENRARKDISDIERARNYADAINRHYGGRAVRMAERLNLSKGWLSKMLKAAAIPDAVLEAFPNLHELTLNPAYQLAIAMEDAGRAVVIGQEARAVVVENYHARKGGHPPLPGTTVVRRLLAAKPPSPAAEKDYRMEMTGPQGRTILSVKGVTRQGITIHLPMASGAGDEQLAQALRSVLETLRLNGITVQ